MIASIAVPTISRMRASDCEQLAHVLELELARSRVVQQLLLLAELSLLEVQVDEHRDLRAQDPAGTA